MFDPYMTHSCAYWVDGAQTLEEAQLANLEMICRKLQLKPGMRVLDLGCGWGSFMRYATERYGVQALGNEIARKFNIRVDFIDIDNPV
jgi:cyclopropane-fatty-acyl-phospholipid synthase